MMDHYDFKPLKALTPVALILIGLLLVGEFTFAYYLATQAAEGFRVDLSAEDLTDTFSVMTVLSGFFWVVLYVVSGIVSLFWIHGAARNACALDSSIDVTPAWAVGWFFVPIAGWFKPFQSMGDIWSASRESAGGGRGGILVLGWWLCQLAANVLMFLGHRLEDMEIARGSYFDLTLRAAGFGTACLATLLFGVMILMIHQGQMQQFQKRETTSTF